MLFESSKPVNGRYFFDREKELQELLQTIPRLKKGAPSYLALLGYRKVGKTSLFEKFMEKAGGGIYAAKIDCWEKENLSLEFLRNYLIKRAPFIRVGAGEREEVKVENEEDRDLF